MAIIKRKNKDGSAFGSYRISVYKGKDENGKKDYIWETFEGNIKQARERETALKHKVNQGEYVKPQKLTVGEFFDKWLEDWSKSNMAPSTHRVFCQQVKNHVKPVLGKLPLTSLNKFKISEYYSDRSKTGLSQQTIRHHRTMMHRAFETAIEWGLVTNNPVVGSSRIRVPKYEAETYSTVEVNKFLQTALKLEPQYYPVFAISFHTGVRRSELCALYWKDVDENFKTISIKRKLFISDHGELLYGQPKTQASQAPIILTETASQILKDHYEYSKSVYTQMKIDFTPDSPVFCHFDTGLPLQPKTVSTAFQRIATEAKLKYIRLHDARHTMATILLKAGVHPKLVQERCRHTSIRTTMDLYSHVIPSMNSEAAQKLDDALKEGYNNSEGKNRDCQ